MAAILGLALCLDFYLVNHKNKLDKMVMFSTTLFMYFINYYSGRVGKNKKWNFFIFVMFSKKLKQHNQNIFFCSFVFMYKKTKKHILQFFNAKRKQTFCLFCRNGFDKGKICFICDLRKRTGKNTAGRNNTVGCHISIVMERKADCCWSYKLKLHVMKTDSS